MNRSRCLSLVALPALCFALAGTASAAPKPDTDGNITAYDHAGKNVLLVVECPRGSLGPEYPKCLERVRSEVQGQVCKPGVGKEIAGKTHYKYRMGAIKTMLADSLTCSGGSGGSGDSGSGDSGGSDDSGDSAGSDGDPKGSCAAYELDGTVIVAKRCPLKSNGRTHDYVTCGQRVRDRAKELICRARGKGLHKYLYRSGESKPSQSSVYCKD
jgi:hypothetical protein